MSTSGLSAVGATAEEAIRDRRPDASARVKDFWRSLIAEVTSLAPDPKLKFDYNDFDQAIDKTSSASLAFAALAKAIAEWNEESAALTLYRGFENIISRYYLPRGVGGYSDEHQFDFYRFIGHELFVTMISTLIAEERWLLIDRVLSDILFVDNYPGGKTEGVNFEYVPQTVCFFMDQEQNRSFYKNYVHGNKLRDRHTQSEFSRIFAFDNFMEADYFLGLKSAFSGAFSKNLLRRKWIPWSNRHLEGVPKFLLKSVQASYAQQLLNPLGVKDIEEFRSKLREHRTFIFTIFDDSDAAYPLSQFDPDTIGTR